MEPPNNSKQSPIARAFGAILRQDKPQKTVAQKSEAVGRALGLFVVVFAVIAVFLCVAFQGIIAAALASPVLGMVAIVVVFGGILYGIAKL